MLRYTPCYHILSSLSRIFHSLRWSAASTRSQQMLCKPKQRTDHCISRAAFPRFPVISWLFPLTCAVQVRFFEFYSKLVHQARFQEKYFVQPKVGQSFILWSWRIFTVTRMSSEVVWKKFDQWKEEKKVQLDIQVLGLFNDSIVIRLKIIVSAILNPSPD